jgi:hypothetical protein
MGSAAEAHAWFSKAEIQGTSNRKSRKVIINAVLRVYNNRLAGSRKFISLCVYFVASNNRA